MDNSDRRKEILNVCLDTFINKGLSETTVRDLSTALKLQSGGIYYWFKDKTKMRPLLPALKKRHFVLRIF